MKYVLDTSVAFKWVVPETDSDKADRLRDDVRLALHELLTPPLLPGPATPEADLSAEPEG